MLLSFLPEFYGFQRVKILRLQEALDIQGANPVSLIDVLAGVSPDYAVVAQKSGSPEQLAIFDDPFSVEYGLTLATLSEKYDQTSRNNIKAIELATEEALLAQKQIVGEQQSERELRNEELQLIKHEHTELERSFSIAFLEETQRGHIQVEALVQKLAQREQDFNQQFQQLQQESQKTGQQQIQIQVELQQQIDSARNEQLRLEREQHILAHKLVQKEEKAVELLRQYYAVELNAAAQLERERVQAVVDMLNALRRQAVQENAEVSRKAAQQQAELNNRQIDHEQALNQRIEAVQEHQGQLQRDSSKREQKALEQSIEARKELETLLRLQLQRERELAAQLLSAQQQSAREKYELVRDQVKTVRELASQQVQREKALTQQLHAHRQELRNHQKKRVKNELDAASEKTALTQRHNQQEQALSRQQADSEKAHNQQLLTQQEQHRCLQFEQSDRIQALLRKQEAQQQELKTMRDAAARREKQMFSELLASQDRTIQATAQLQCKQLEQEQALQRQHAEREVELRQQVEELGQVLHCQKKESAQVNLVLKSEITTLQNETQILREARETQLKEHDVVLSTKLREHTHLLEVCATLESKFQAEVASVQTVNLHLNQSLAEVQYALTKTHDSFSWRTTEPLRKLIENFRSSRYPPPTAPNSMSDHAALGHCTQNASQDLLTTNNTTRKSAMQEPTQPAALNMSKKSSTMYEILACHDQQFVQCAYLTILGRTPDDQGLDYYLSMIRAGCLKIQILSQLRLSKEGRVHSINVPGLDAAIKHHRRGKQPLIGWFYRLINGMEGYSPTERRQRAIENQLFVINTNFDKRLDN